MYTRFSAAYLRANSCFSSLSSNTAFEESVLGIVSKAFKGKMQSLFAHVYVPLRTMSSPLSEPYGSSLESHAVVQWERVCQEAWPIWEPGNRGAPLRFPCGTIGWDSLMLNWLETQRLGAVQGNKTFWFSKSKLNIDISKLNYFATFHFEKDGNISAFLFLF